MDSYRTKHRVSVFDLSEQFIFLICSQMLVIEI